MKPNQKNKIEMRYIVLAVFLTVLPWSVCSAEEKPMLKDRKDKESYSLGYRLGNAYRKQGMDVNPDAFLKGFQDALSGEVPALSRGKMRNILRVLKSRTRIKHPEQYRREGSEFMAVNAKKPGVVTLPSGLQYKVIRQGTGRAPGPRDTVTVNYRGTYIDGSELDNTYERGEPAEFVANSVIPGWAEALQLMREGARWQIFIPPDLAYSTRGPMAHRTLIFDVELISVKPGG